MSNVNLTELFNEDLSTPTFQEPTRNERGQDGLVRIDVKKLDPKEGSKIVMRFLPNFKKDGTKGNFYVNKKSHYVKIDSDKRLNGYYDSPENFGETCALSAIFRAHRETKNAIIKSRLKSLAYNDFYFSYVLVIDDEQNPSNNGKIMIFQYKKAIKKLIEQEEKGERGRPCKVMSLTEGKDFVYKVKNVKTDSGDTVPSPKDSFFKEDRTPISIPNKDGKLTQVKVTDGQIDPKHLQAVYKFIMSREHDLEEFEAKPLTDEQKAKVSDIVSYIEGKASTSFQTKEVSSDEFFSAEEDDDFGTMDASTAEDLDVDGDLDMEESSAPIASDDEDEDFDF